MRARCAFLRCAHRPAAPPSTRARLSPAFSMLASTPRRLADHAPVLVLRRDAQAHACRTLPRHAGGSAATRRGQRRPAAAARSGRVDGIAAGSLVRPAPRSGTTVRSLARAFFLTPGFAACWSAVVRAAMRVHMCGRCGGAAGLAGFVVGSAFVCVRSGAAPVWSAQCEVWSRDVFVSSSELVIEYYNMSIRSIKIFAHSYHLADALAPLWHKSRQPMGSQASTRPRTSRCATRWRR